MDATIAQLQQLYSGKGFYVTAIPYNSGVSVEFSKDDSGFKKWIGLALGIRANISISNGYLYISFTDAEWTGKIVAIAVGWFMCLVPLITGIIGAVAQNDFPRLIANDIQMLAMGNTPGAPPQQQNQQAPPQQQQWQNQPPPPPQQNQQQPPPPSQDQQQPPQQI